MEFLADIGSFLLKAGIIIFAFVIITGVIAQAAQKQKKQKGELEVTHLSKEIQQMQDALRMELLDKKARKKAEKLLKKARKSEKKHENRLFVIDFKGSMDAKEVENLRREINAVLSIASDKDDVLIRLESGGGVVNG